MSISGVANGALFVQKNLTTWAYKFVDSPDCLLLFLSISVFLLLAFFLFLHFLVVGFRAVD